MTRTSATAPSIAALCLAGALALALAMGIGRFAFTPLLPLMMRDGRLDAGGGAVLAAANYLGYLAGALSAGRLARRPLRLLRLSLPSIALLTAATGVCDGVPAWGLLRFAAGVASAWTLVGVSSWTLGELSRLDRPQLAGRVYAGVGSGIALAGSLAWALGRWPANALWTLLGAVALLLALAVLGLTRGGPAADAAVAAPAPGRPPRPAGARGPVLCYGLFGFGYILPATFLPTMARALVDDPARFGLAWPLFGAAAALSTLLSARALARWHRLRVWAVCQAAMALGAALPLLSRSGAAIAAAALLVGGSFMVATVAGLQQARALAPQQPAPLLARMTAAFALGQIAGPLAVRALAGLGLGDGTAVDLASAVAALALAASAAWLWRQAPAASAVHGAAA